MVPTLSRLGKLTLKNAHGVFPQPSLIETKAICYYNLTFYRFCLNTNFIYDYLSDGEEKRNMRRHHTLKSYRLISFLFERRTQLRQIRT